MRSSPPLTTRSAVTAATSARRTCDRSVRPTARPPSGCTAAGQEIPTLVHGLRGEVPGSRGDREPAQVVVGGVPFVPLGRLSHVGQRVSEGHGLQGRHSSAVGRRAHEHQAREPVLELGQGQHVFAAGRVTDNTPAQVAHSVARVLLNADLAGGCSCPGGPSTTTFAARAGPTGLHETRRPLPDRSLTYSTSLAILSNVSDSCASDSRGHSFAKFGSSTPLQS